MKEYSAVKQSHYFNKPALKKEISLYNINTDFPITVQYVY